MDNQFLKKTIGKSQESAGKGLFPAGAIIVKEGNILASETSSTYPGFKHAELKAIEQAFAKEGNFLKDCILYASMESCLMCISAAYWAGIRKIVFAIGKNSVSPSYYEFTQSNQEIINKFHDKMELIHQKEFEQEALEIVKAWETKMGM